MRRPQNKQRGSLRVRNCLARGGLVHVCCGKDPGRTSIQAVQSYCFHAFGSKKMAETGHNAIRAYQRAVGHIEAGAWSGVNPSSIAGVRALEQVLPELLLHVPPTLGHRFRKRGAGVQHGRDW